MSDQVEGTKFPSEVVDLPSRGYFYPDDHPLSNGQIEIKYPTAKEEDILASQNLIKRGVVIDKFMESLIVTPVDFNTILAGDKNGIMIASRILAYGSEYRAKVQCPSCGNSVKTTIDLSTLQSKDIDFSKFDKGQQEFEFKLPKSEKVVKFKHLTHAEERLIEKELTAMRTRSGGNATVDVTTRLKHIITEFDGSRDNGDIFREVKDIFSQDSLPLREYIRSVTPDIDLGVDFTCDVCAHSDRIFLPMDVSFFWPGQRL